MTNMPIGSGVATLVFAWIVFTVAWSLLVFYAHKENLIEEPPLVYVQGIVTNVQHSFVNWDRKISETQHAFPLPPQEDLHPSSSSLTEEQKHALWCAETVPYLNCEDTNGFATDTDGQPVSVKQCNIFQGGNCFTSISYKLPRVDTHVTVRVNVDGTEFTKTFVTSKNVYPQAGVSVSTQLPWHPAVGDTVQCRYREGYMQSTLSKTSDPEPHAEGTGPDKERFNGLIIGAIAFLIMWVIATSLLWFIWTYRNRSDSEQNQTSELDTTYE